MPVLALCAIRVSGLAHLQPGLTGLLTDNDTLMRLARLRQVMETGGWHGGFFLKDNAPYGMVVHWSLLFDLPILAVAWILSWFMPFAAALHLAGIFTGPVIGLSLPLAACWLAAPVLDRAGQRLAGLSVALSIPILGYGDIGRANHHVALPLALMVVAGFILRAWIAPGRTAPALAAGIAAGFSLWLSFELLPIVVLPATLALALLWVRDGRERLPQNLAFAAGLAAIAIAGLLIDPPYEGLAAAELDRLSAPYVALTLLLVCAWCGLAMVGPSAGRGARLAAGLVAACLAAAAWVALYPCVLAGVDGQIDPVVRRVFLPQIREVRPATRSLRQFIQYAWVGCLGPLAALSLLWLDRARDQRFTWVILACGSAALAALGLAHCRFTPYSWIMGGLLVATLCQRLKTGPEGLARLAPAGALLLCLLVPLSGALLPDAAADAEATGDRMAITDPAQACSVEAVSAPLNDPSWFGKTAGIIATDIDSAPAVLYWTPHGTLFGPYHRNGAGLHDLLALFHEPDDAAAQAIAKARGIDAILVCATHPHEALISDGPDSSLFRRLVDRRPPAWLALQAWPKDVRSGYLLYRVTSTTLGPIPQK
jgi:hypothetical protein